MVSVRIARSLALALMLVITLVPIMCLLPSARADSMYLTPAKSFYYPHDTITISLSTSNTYDVFYVQIVNSTGETIMNWTNMVAPGGNWSATWVLPLSMSEGQYDVKARSSIDHTVWCQTFFAVMAFPSNASYVLYDMFEQPWGEWWIWRDAAYHNCRILSNSSGNYTMLYSSPAYPDPAHREIIYAPYRWNATLTSYGALSVDWPEFMPVCGPIGIPGAEASVAIHFDYLSWSWWNDYWVPTWQDNPDWAGNDPMLAQASDGWVLGTVYEVIMNREAAETLLGLPQVVDPAEWWAANSQTYLATWNSWIEHEGNVRLDVWCALEWPYTIFGTMMDIQALPTGELVLNIGHFSFGYEALMTRWLTETRICVHEPLYEDFTLVAEYGATTADVTFDAACQYNLHAVKANESASGAAWVWEPTRIDRVASWDAGHPVPYGSDHDPWKDLKYQSWNAGDSLFGQNVSYEYTPQWFNLTENQRLTVEQPRHGAVIGYEGVNPWPEGPWIPPPDPIPVLYDGITLHGYMSLGFYITDASGGGADLDAAYDNSTKKLTIVGPASFDNARHADGAIYHGAPWIEFNVTVDTDPPEADAGLDFSVTQGSYGTLDGSGSRDDIGLVSWNWTFDDGGLKTISGEIVQYRFDSLGIVNVTLNVSDVNGNYDIDWVEVTVLQDAEPPVAIAASDRSVVEIGQTVTLVGTASSDNVGVVNWTWTILETPIKTVYGSTAFYAFGSAGNYSVKLTVTDAVGLTGEDAITIQVVPPNQPPVANAGPDRKVRVGTTVQFDGTGSSDDMGVALLNLTWEFYHQSKLVKLYGERPEFKFEDAGSYTVKLTVRDSEGLASSDEVLVVVEEKSGIGSLTLAVAGIVVVVVAVVVLLLWMRKRGATPVKSEGSS